jgi:DNA polymerase sigma
MLAYARYVAPTPAERAARERVRRRVEGVVYQRFRDARVGCYGSSMNGLCLPDGCVALCSLVVRGLISWSRWHPSTLQHIYECHSPL